MKTTYIIWQVVKIILHALVTLIFCDWLLTIMGQPVHQVIYVFGMIAVICWMAGLVINIVVTINKIKNQLDV